MKRDLKKTGVSSRKLWKWQKIEKGGNKTSRGRTRIRDVATAPQGMKRKRFDTLCEFGMS